MGEQYRSLHDIIETAPFRESFSDGELTISDVAELLRAVSTIVVPYQISKISSSLRKTCRSSSMLPEYIQL